MALKLAQVASAVALAVMLSSCGGVAQLPVSAGMGANPALPEPEHSLLPTVNVAKATGWPAGGTPIAAPGLAVNAFSVALRHPRWVYVLPNGDVLVAESNAPVRPDEGGGVRGFFMKLIMGYAGAGAESANRITLLRDTNGDGVADVRTVFVDQLNSPFGMALIGADFYVANTDAVVRYHYTAGATSLTGPGTKVLDLPAGTRNHHWTKNLIASPDGRKLYVTVGSNSNVGENGMEIEVGRAAIWEVDIATGAHRVFASGLRNPNGLAWVPPGNALWAAVNERDELGSDLVPDYMTAVHDGAFYGWPYSYYGQHVDERVQPPRPDLVAQARVPDYALGAHTASLGLAWSAGLDWPAPFARGLLVGQHGSWNRKPRSGYQVVFVPFAGDNPAGLPLNVLTGFVNADGEALGRPVGVAVDTHGGLLVADDVGNVVWRVTRAPH